MNRLYRIAQVLAITALAAGVSQHPKAQITPACPHDSDVVMILARNHVLPPNGEGVEDPLVSRTWEVGSKDPSRMKRVRLQFGTNIPNDQMPKIPEKIKNKKMILFFECTNGQGSNLDSVAIWSRKGILESIPYLHESQPSFKINDLGIAIVQDEITVSRLGQCLDKPVNIGILHPKHRLAERLFTDGIVPKAILLNASR